MSDIRSFFGGNSSSYSNSNKKALIKAVLEDIQECPICLCEIEGRKNIVTTECGHTFHCKCLMQNVAHNGFACPFCRTEMADIIEDEDDEDDEARYDDDSSGTSFDEASRAEDYDSDSEYGDDLEDIINYHQNAIQQETEDHMLRGMRWMFQREEEDEDEEVVAVVAVATVAEVEIVTVETVETNVVASLEDNNAILQNYYDY